MPTFSMPAHLLQHGFGLGRQNLQAVQVGADDLDRVVSLDAGEGLHHVVADVLREIPGDAGELFAQLGVHRGDDLVLRPSPLGAEQPAPPAGRSTSNGQSCSGRSGTKYSLL